MTRRGYYVAHLIKALRNEGLRWGSNGLISVNVSRAICFNLVHKHSDLLSKQAENIPGGPHRIQSVDLLQEGIYILCRLHHRRTDLSS